MIRPGIHRSRSLLWALCLNAALLVAILLVLLGRDGSPQILPAAFGQNQPPIAGGAGVFIVPAQFTPNSFGCYLMDVDAQTICAYQFISGKLKLIAARSFQYDRRLRDFNTEAPSPAEVKHLVDLEQQSGRVIDRNTDHPPVEAPAKQD